ncbi:hypothetical protein DH2020_028583 [Rehmannia glutinosa]|uniref:Alpha/beta hydrolase fold-3 domain-containing protein n=1 Tax=Rehmannia glutinosa TaxID=99300 RepID=A0ABR0VQY3_REHGL
MKFGTLNCYTDGTVERLFGSPHVPPSPEDPTTGVSSKDTTISPLVSARLYLPKLTHPTTQTLPILVYYHCGAFCLESAFSFLHHRYINLLSSAAGALVISVEYRLAPETPLPAAYDDSREALKWVCSHGADLNQTHFEKLDQWIANHGDFSRVFIGGDTSGANIAHNIAIRAGSEPLPGNVKIVGAILSHPYFWGSNPIGKDVDRSLAYRFWVFVYPTAAGGIDNPSINPLIDGAPSLSGLGCSKMMITLAMKDELTGRGLVYAEKVKNSGWKGEVEVVEVEGEEHCFHIFDTETEKARDLIKRMANFISQ